jgi:hypothetical protein
MTLENLRGAFGGLSEAHHQILVMRELEGLSYRQIGERLGMSRPSVESTLFRARRRLSEEYQELVSGERCRRIQTIIAGATGGRLGVRDERKMARHVSYCQPCRRAAFAAGFDPAALQPKRTMREKIAALLPIPAFAKRWIAGGPVDHGSRFSTVAQYGDIGGGAWVKAAAAAAAVLVAGMGADAVRPHGNPAPAARPPAAVKAAPAATTTPTHPAKSTSSGRGAGTTSHHRQGKKSHGSSGSSSSGKTSGSGGSSTQAPSSQGGSGSSPSSSSTTGKSATSSGADGPLKKAVRTVTDELPTGGSTGTQVPAPQLPEVKVPTVPGAPPVVNDTVGAVNGAAGQVTGTVNGAASQATGAVNGTVSGATGAASDTTKAAGDTVNTVTGGILGGG